MMAVSMMASSRPTVDGPFRVMSASDHSLVPIMTRAGVTSGFSSRAATDLLIASWVGYASASPLAAKAAWRSISIPELLIMLRLAPSHTTSLRAAMAVPVLPSSMAMMTGRVLKSSP